MSEEKNDVTEKMTEFPCEKCGGIMKFSPKSQVVTCVYCNHEMSIPSSDAEIHELDFHAYLSQAEEQENVLEESTVVCSSCGAETTFSSDTRSDECPFCGTPIVAEPHQSRKIRPRSLLPFKVTRKESVGCFQNWIKSLWFAPNKLKKYAVNPSQKLNGVYIPYWTYDANTISHYSGERGDDYYVTQTYTTTENGKSVTKTRQVRKTRWHHVSGVVYRSFDDVLVLGSDSLPTTCAEKLEPWDLENLVAFDENYLAGFRCERYSVDLEQGFEKASSLMDDVIRGAVKRDIGGDHQRIHSVHTEHRNLTFKHILLPIWISAYHYNNKLYSFLINARTGEVQGERPWSFWKIASACLAVAAVIGGIILYLRMAQG